MEELIQILDALERKGWVCLLKWDGERTSKHKTVVVQKTAHDKLFRGDFHNFDQALESLQEWLTEQDANDNKSEAGPGG